MGAGNGYIEYKAFLLCGRSCVVKLLHLQSINWSDRLGQSKTAYSND